MRGHAEVMNSSYGRYRVNLLQQPGFAGCDCNCLFSVFCLLNLLIVMLFKPRCAYGQKNQIFFSNVCDSLALHRWD